MNGLGDLMPCNRTAMFVWGKFGGDFFFAERLVGGRATTSGRNNVNDDFWRMPLNLILNMDRLENDLFDAAEDRLNFFQAKKSRDADVDGEDNQSDEEQLGTERDDATIADTQWI